MSTTRGEAPNEDNGTHVTSRNPAHKNMLGFDIKNIGASGVIKNNATSATFTFSSNGDVYYPGVVGLAINLFAPDYTTSTKNVTHLDGNTPARPGDTLQYTVNLFNTGQDKAVDVVSTDPIPAGATYVPGTLEVQQPDGSWLSVSDAVGDDVGEVTGGKVTVRLGAGASAGAGGTMGCTGSGCTPVGDPTAVAAYRFHVTVDDAAGNPPNQVQNVASVDYHPETTPGVNGSYTLPEVVTPVIEAADLAITKEMTPDPVAPGETVTATLTVVNNGPNAAQNVRVTDTPPSPWVIQGTPTTTKGSCSVAGGTVTCALGTMATGETQTVTMALRAPAGTPAGTLVNSASVTTDSWDPDYTNNVSSDSVRVLPRADLAITKSGAPATVTPGEQMTWTMTVTNNGPSDAQGVWVYDALDAADRTRMTFTGATANPSSGAGCAWRAATVTCQIGSLAVGATATVTVTAVVSPDAGADAGPIDNRAMVSSQTNDGNPDNNAAGASITVGAADANLKVTKVATPDPATPGLPVTWLVTIENEGPSTASGVTFTDTIHDAVGNVRAASTRGTCTVAGQQVSCDVGVLRPGGRAIIAITGDLDPAFDGTRLPNLEWEVDPDGPDIGVPPIGPPTDPELPETSCDDDQPDCGPAVSPQFDLGVTKRSNQIDLPTRAPAKSLVMRPGPG